MKKGKNKLEYFLTMFIILICFLVIYLSTEYLKNTIYSNNIVKQPINNIYSIDNGHVDEIEFIYDEGKDKTNVIRLYNQFPISDEVGMALVGEYRTHDFKIRVNKKAVGIKYQITAERLTGSDFDENLTKLYLEMNGVGLDNCFRESGRIKHFTEYPMYNSKYNERILYEGVISQEEAKRGYIDFTFRMWVSEDLVKTNEDYLSQTFLARINVYATDKF